MGYTSFSHPSFGGCRASCSFRFLKRGKPFESLTGIDIPHGLCYGTSLHPVNKSYLTML